MPQNNILTAMELVRDYCNIGHSIRRECNIPVSYPLKEIQVNSIYAGSCLFKSEYKLIGEELNIDIVEPILTPTFGENWIEKKVGDLIVKIDISKSKSQEERHNARREHREKMQQRKDATTSSTSNK